ncbi:hypothetical protein GCM10010405_51270 [Streptomyces macrosporus]|uniref:Secreted protein n=1 Tax=Streptomyces macrosporus TaxID=44032 RepID=A0ABP5XMQ7_9ACTN
MRFSEIPAVLLPAAGPVAVGEVSRGLGVLPDRVPAGVPVRPEPQQADRPPPLPGWWARTPRDGSFRPVHAGRKSADGDVENP